MKHSDAVEDKRVPVKARGVFAGRLIRSEEVSEDATFGDELICR
jgi:hypothetical protein